MLYRSLGISTNSLLRFIFVWEFHFFYHVSYCPIVIFFDTFTPSILIFRTSKKGHIVPRLALLLFERTRILRGAPLRSYCLFSSPSSGVRYCMNVPKKILHLGSRWVLAAWAISDCLVVVLLSSRCQTFPPDPGCIELSCLATRLPDGIDSCYREGSRGGRLFLMPCIVGLVWMYHRWLSVLA